VNLAFGIAARASPTIISASSGANILDEECMFELGVLGVGCSGRFSSARDVTYIHSEKNIFLVYRFKQHILNHSNPANSSQLPLSSVSPHSVQV
jgi:hypothetical protein